MNTLTTTKETIYRSESPDETIAIGKSLALAHPRGACFYLEGELGAGKTLLTKGIAAGYGVPPHRVVSPTFALVNRYGGGTRTLYHVDLYRIENERELEELGLDELEQELAHDRGKERAVIVVEWSEKLDELGGYRRPDAVVVRLDMVSENSRRIRISETAAAGTKP